jgi:hypothetical protein
MLTRNVNPIIPVALTLTRNGAEPVKFNVNFRNMRTSEVQAMFADESLTLADVVLRLVDSWETEFPLDAEGLKDMEDIHPGLAKGILSAFGDARQVAVEKN